jgi:hypothetical protein
MSASEREQVLAYSSRTASGDHDSCEAAVSTAGANRDIMSASEREQVLAYSSRTASGDHDSCEAAVSTAGANRDIIYDFRHKLLDFFIKMLNI